VYTKLDKKYNGNIPIDQLVTLCDQLKLYILNSSDDISFHFKFLDVMNRKYSKISSDNQFINRDMYLLTDIDI